MILNDDVFHQLNQTLAATDALLASAYPGDDGRRQAVHTAMFLPISSASTPHNIGVKRR